MSLRVETRTSTTWIDEEGIARSMSRPGLHETLDDAIENVRGFLKMTGAQKRLLLVDLRPLTGQDSKAIDYYRGALNGSILFAAAFLINSKLGSALGNIFMPKKNAVPIKLFTDERTALAWLREQKPARPASPADAQSPR